VLRPSSDTASFPQCPAKRTALSTLGRLSASPILYSGADRGVCPFAQLDENDPSNRTRESVEAS
jgi:hypothetical protein